MDSAAMNIFRAVCHQENPQLLITPHKFCSDLFLSMHNHVNDSEICSPHSQVLFSSELGLPPCKLMVAVSMTAAVFNYCEYHHINAEKLKLRLSSTSASEKTSSNKDNGGLHIESVDLAQSVYQAKGEAASCQSPTFDQDFHNTIGNGLSVTDWYGQTLLFLLERKIVFTLVTLLQSKCQVIAYVARKTLVTGTRNNFFEVADVLSALETDIIQRTAEESSEVIDLLVQLMSFKSSNSGSVQSLTCKWIVNCVLGIQINITLETSVCVSRRMIGLLQLWKCVLKYLSQCSSDFAISKTLCLLFEEKLLPLADHFFQLEKPSLGHLVCIQYLKVISSMLSLQAFIPVLVHQTALFFLESSPSLFSCGRNSGLFNKTDFVGSSIDASESGLETVSTLTKSFILVLFEASAVLLQGRKACEVSQLVVNSIQFLLHNVCHVATPVAGSALSLDWLPTMFGDQDDKWISALFCLLKIWRYGMRHGWQEGSGREKDLHLAVLQNSAGGEKDKAQEGCNSAKQQNECLTSTGDLHCMAQTGPFQFQEVDLLRQISPHKLFLQFASFIDHDHLVLADFLTSPETCFLAYFTAYLHDLEKDWLNFTITCQQEEDSECDKTVIKHKNSTASLSVCQSPLLAPLQFFNENSKDNKDKNLGLEVLKTDDEVCPSSQHCPRQENVSFRKRPNGDLNFYMNNVTGLCSKETTATALNTAAKKPNLSLVVYTDSDSSSCADDAGDSGEEDSDINSMCSDENPEGNSLFGNKDSDKHSFCSDDNTDRNSLCTDENSAANILSSLLKDTKQNSEGIVKEKMTTKSLNMLTSQPEESAIKEQELHTIPQDKNIDHVMGMLIRLRYHVQRLSLNNLFPYNATPILKLLTSCENCYENLTDSSGYKTP